MSWWRDGVIYQVYPRSFQDATATASATCAGIRAPARPTWPGSASTPSWLSPFYRSPMADFGYDVSDHRDVDPLFGTLEDFDALVAEAHALGLRLILDYVPNHTSDQHPWFARASPRLVPVARRAAEQLGQRVRRPGLDLDAATGASTTTPTCREQPDLNWRNPERARGDARRAALLARRAASTASASTRCAR